MAAAAAAAAATAAAATSITRERESLIHWMKALSATTQVVLGSPHFHHYGGREREKGEGDACERFQ